MLVVIEFLLCFVINKFLLHYTWIYCWTEGAVFNMILKVFMYSLNAYIAGKLGAIVHYENVRCAMTCKL